MKINEIAEILNADILIDFSNEDTDIEYGFASDLMSDVLAYANSESLLIRTGDKDRGNDGYVYRVVCEGKKAMQGNTGFGRRKYSYRAGNKLYYV